MASASMVAIGSPGDLLVHWFWWALVMVPFCFVVFQLVVRMSKLSVLLCLCAVAAAVKINPVSQVIGLLQGFAHHVTTDAGAEVKAFNAYAEWCKDQAQDDGHQQETLDASFGRHRELCRQG